MRKILLVVLAMSLMLGFGVLAVGAQDDTEGDDTTATTPLWQGGMRGMRGGFGLADGTSQLTLAAEALGMDEAALIAAFRNGQTLAELAEEQGIELDSITATFTAAYEEQLAAAVEAGDITQEEADAMMVLHAARQEDFAAGAFAFGNMFGSARGQMMNQGQRGGMWNNGPQGQMMHQGGFGLAGGPQDMIAVAAEALGMAEADLTAALQSGQTLAEIAEEQGIEIAVITAAFDAVHAERIAAAIEAGYLTEEQAALMQEQHAAMQAAIASGEYTPGSMFGGRMMDGGSRGQRGGQHPRSGMWNQNQN